MHAVVPRLERHARPAAHARRPAIGQHNDEIYARIGYSDERIAALAQNGRHLSDGRAARPALVADPARQRAALRREGVHCAARMRSSSTSRTRCRPPRRPTRAPRPGLRSPLAGRGGAEVLVRVNNDPAHLWPTTSTRRCTRARRPVAAQGGVAPSRSAELVAPRRGARARARPRARPRAPVARARDARAGCCARRGDRARRATASPRMGVGVEDYCLELGVEPSAGRRSSCSTRSPALVTIAKAAGVQPTGLVGSIAGFRDLARVRGRRPRAPASSAARARAASIPIR